MSDQRGVDPGLYTAEYFLTDNEGCREYSKGLDTHIHPKFKKALEIAKISSKDVVLDIGCGRGEILYYCAKRKARALGIDYSADAIRLAQKTIDALPADIRAFARAQEGDAVRYDFNEKYTVVFMVEIAEHMYDWQLSRTFEKIHDILDDKGKLIIITPNHYYERYLSPMKRAVNIPLNLVKWLVRAIRGGYSEKSPLAAFFKIFRIRPDRGELNRLMHVNVSTPAKFKKMLAGFDADIRCEDHSKNILSLLTRRWWGRDIVIVARPKKESPYNIYGQQDR